MVFINFSIISILLTQKNNRAQNYITSHCFISSLKNFSFTLTNVRKPFLEIRRNQYLILEKHDPTALSSLFAGLKNFKPLS
jgi:hypothetical protein